MRQTSYTATKKTPRGVRLWLEGQKLQQCGFVSDALYIADFQPDNHCITLTLDKHGDRKVSAAKRNGQERPIIDLLGQRVESVFPANSKIQVVLSDGIIMIQQHHESVSQIMREQKFRQRKAAGRLLEASMFTGGGISTEAIAMAGEKAGLRSRVAWVAEMESKYIESAGQNCLAIDDQTQFLIGSVEEIHPRLFTDVDILSFSMPCAGFSKAGKSKHKMTSEEHSGTALFGVMNAIKSANPAVLISENVTEAMGSPIYQLLTAELRRTGYRIFEQCLNQAHTGTLENRERYWMVAVSEGLAPKQLQLPVLKKARKCISEILDPNQTVEKWSSNKHLHVKAARDKAAGKGFKRQLLVGTEDRCGTIGRFYSKKRSTEPFIVNEKGQERLFSPVEHARIKGIPERLIEGQVKTTAHEILGQSVDFRQPYNLALALFTNLAQAS